MLSLTCVTGCPGSGKSHMANELKNLGFDIIAIDDYAESKVVENDVQKGKKYQWIVDISKIVHLAHSIEDSKHDERCFIAIEGTCSNFPDLYNALVKEFEYVLVFFIYTSPVVLREVYRKRIHRMSKDDHFYDTFVRLNNLSNNELEGWSLNRILEVTDKGINVRFINRSGYYTIFWLMLFIENLIARFEDLDPSTLSLINDSSYKSVFMTLDYELLEPTAFVSKQILESSIFEHQNIDYGYYTDRVLIGELYKAFWVRNWTSNSSFFMKNIRSSNKYIICNSIDFLLKCREVGII